MTQEKWKTVKKIEGKKMRTKEGNRTIRKNEKKTEKISNEKKRQVSTSILILIS